MNLKHGLTRRGKIQPIFNSWTAMMRRCYQSHRQDFKNYGGRGIQVAERWHTFSAFAEAMLPTWRPGLTLDRKNNDSHYGPGLCQWSDVPTQNKKKRTVVMLEQAGLKLSRADWARRLGITWDTLNERIKKWGIKEALSVSKTTKWKHVSHAPEK